MPNELLNESLLKTTGLETSRIRLHQERIKAALENRLQTTIPVTGAATLENGGIVSWSCCKDWLAAPGNDFDGAEALAARTCAWQVEHLVTMIPAAGAASRFLAELQKFVQEVDSVIVVADSSEKSGELRNNIVAKLQQVQVSAKFAALPELLAKQKFDLVKIEWQSLLSVLVANNLGNDVSASAQNARTVLSIYAGAKVLLKLFGGVPKALVPTTTAGDTFLHLKLLEQEVLLPCLGNVVVVPPEQESIIAKVIANEGYSVVNVGSRGSPSTSKQAGGVWRVMEQGRELSTIRFNIDGTPYVDAEGNYSLVAAGHGELVQLFGSIAQEFNKAEALHIRNVDNVIGNNASRTSEMSTFAQTFYLLREAVEIVRERIEAFVGSEQSAKQDFIVDDVCLRALARIGKLISGEMDRHEVERVLAECQAKRRVSLAALQRVFSALCYWPTVENPTNYAKHWQTVRELLARPISLFGVVRKEAGDVGGGPVVVRLPDGSQAKLCMEMPHASATDLKEYFSEGGKSTHFNPVLVLFELRTGTRMASNSSSGIGGKMVDFRRLFDDRFWLLSKKEHQGKPVCYHETVLYELIGNSATANLIFIEVPRTLFNPHKTVFESLGRSREDYGFNEATVDASIVKPAR